MGERPYKHIESLVVIRPGGFGAEEPEARGLKEPSLKCPFHLWEDSTILTPMHSRHLI